MSSSDLRLWRGIIFLNHINSQSTTPIYYRYHYSTIMDANCVSERSYTTARTTTATTRRKLGYGWEGETERKKTMDPSMSKRNYNGNNSTLMKRKKRSSSSSSSYPMALMGCLAVSLLILPLILPPLPPPPFMLLLLPIAILALLFLLAFMPPSSSTLTYLEPYA